MSTFRIATVNIHQFRLATYSKNINSLVSVLQPLQLDLIAVQEINNDYHWHQFCEQLGLKNSIIGKCDEWFLSNGIASQHPIISHSNQIGILSCPGEKRAMLQCRLGGDHPFVQDRSFAVTHLDHIDEDDRLAQIKEFDPVKHNIDILMGDMNALTRDDYSDNYYQNMIVHKREKSSWEKPHFDLTQLIREEWNYQDAFRLANPHAKDKEVVTCAMELELIIFIYVHVRMINGN
ncbi:hypothetical protein I4U23_005976 [Adineta vaga]|nr:hypothetical protein I4U23_005976 [Adineta vaga]